MEKMFETESSSLRKKLGLFLAPVAFILAYISPLFEQNFQAHKVFSLFILVIILWITEALPLPITSILIPVMGIIMGITNFKESFEEFANPVIFLFLGCFIVAKGMSYHKLDERIASLILSSKFVAGNPIRILFAFGMVTAFMSMWVQNTATTAMMLPIGYGIFLSVSSKIETPQAKRFGMALLLSTAYAASVGGVGTPVGTAPNMISLGFMLKFLDKRITFFQWMEFGLIVVFLTYLSLFILFRRYCPKTKIHVEGIVRKQGKLTNGQINVLGIFSIVVFLWIFPGFISIFKGTENSLYKWLNSHLPEYSVALIGAILIFIFPTNWKKGEFTLPIKEALSIDWGTLLLFGGGLTLGGMMFESGFTHLLANSLVENFRINSLGVLTLVCIVFSTILTEFTSNTATVSMFIPIVISISNTLNLNPIPPVLGATIGASYAFALPVSTPPNAIVYGSGLIPLNFMIKSGIVMNLIGITINWTVAMTIPRLIGL